MEEEGIGRGENVDLSNVTVDVDTAAMQCSACCYVASSRMSGNWLILSLPQICKATVKSNGHGQKNKKAIADANVSKHLTEVRV